MLADVELSEVEGNMFECGVGGCTTLLRSNAGVVLLQTPHTSASSRARANTPGYAFY